MAEAKGSADEEVKEEAREDETPGDKAGELVAADNSEVDEELVEKACREIMSEFSEYVKMGVQRVGWYLIREFFDNNIEKARGKNKIRNSSKGATLNQVFNRFSRGSEEAPKAGGPSKSWLYQVIELVIQWWDVKHELPKKSFQTYGKILLSHQAELLSVKDMKIKEELIHRIYDENLTVRELREEISKAKGSVKKRTPGLLTIINRPENLDDEESQEMLKLDNLQSKPYGKLKDLPDKIDKKKESLQAEIEEMENKATAYKKYLKKYDALKKNVEKAIPLAKENSKSKKGKKQE